MMIASIVILLLLSTVNCFEIPLTRRFLNSSFINRKLFFNKDGSEEFTQHGKIVFTIPVNIGTPPQTLNLFFDTLSSTTWVISKQCRSFECTGRAIPGYYKYTRTLYDIKSSSTSKTTNLSYNYPATKNCTAIRDNISIGDLDLGLQTFGEKLSVDFSIGFEPLDGFISLGTYSSAQNRFTPIVKTLEKSLKNPQFTIYLKKIGSNFTNPSMVEQNNIELMKRDVGSITFGRYDDKHCGKIIDAIPTKPELDQWQFQVDQLSLGADRIPESTGSSLISFAEDLSYVPGNALNEIAKKLGGVFDTSQNLFKINCKAELPPIVLKINGKDYKIESNEYKTFARFNSNCFLGLRENFSKNYSYIIGRQLFYSYCVNFNIKNKTIGLANAL